MNASSENFIDRAERLLARDEDYKAILEKLFLLDIQHCGKHFTKESYSHE